MNSFQFNNLVEVGLLICVVFVPMVSFAVAAAASVLLRSGRKEARSRRPARPGGTSGCSPEISTGTASPPLLDFVYGRLMGDHPSCSL